MQEHVDERGIRPGGVALGVLTTGVAAALVGVLHVQLFGWPGDARSAGAWWYLPAVAVAFLAAWFVSLATFVVAGRLTWGQAIVLVPVVAAAAVLVLVLVTAP